MVVRWPNEGLSIDLSRYKYVYACLVSASRFSFQKFSIFSKKFHITQHFRSFPNFRWISTCKAKPLLAHHVMAKPRKHHCAGIRCSSLLLRAKPLNHISTHRFCYRLIRSANLATFCLSFLHHTKRCPSFSTLLDAISPPLPTHPMP